MWNRLAEPDYQLAWPRKLFVSEAAKLLDKPRLPDWDDRCSLLLRQAFVSGYEGGPSDEFHEVPAGVLAPTDKDPWDVEAEVTLRQQFLLELAERADQLAEDSSGRRPYWSQRLPDAQPIPALDQSAVVREFIALITDLYSNGFFEKRFGSGCKWDRPDERTVEILFRRELGVDDLWPLQHDRLAKNLDRFFDVVELLHDQVARPGMRRFCDEFECEWHHSSFEIEPGRVAYRWRVNEILGRSDLGLQLADEGDDVGRLVTVTDDARTDLIQAVISRVDNESTEQVRHALSLFRQRGADRHQKRSAVAALALILEERRHTTLVDALAKSDRGALFDIANNFHIRHQDAKQKRHYDEFYLDWIFWVYLASIELSNRVIDQQELNGSAAEPGHR